MFVNGRSVKAMTVKHADCFDDAIMHYDRKCKYKVT
jgi:hypothetical protein